VLNKTDYRLDQQGDQDDVMQIKASYNYAQKHAQSHELACSRHLQKVSPHPPKRSLMWCPHGVDVTNATLG
jgi:hypothetical protein